MEKKDERLKIVGEILRGIKVSVLIHHFEEIKSILGRGRYQ